jgi:hypothetical protein
LLKKRLSPIHRRQIGSELSLGSNAHAAIQMSASRSKSRIEATADVDTMIGQFSQRTLAARLSCKLPRTFGAHPALTSAPINGPGWQAQILVLTGG